MNLARLLAVLLACPLLTCAQTSPPSPQTSPTTADDAANAKAHALLARAVRINGPSVEGAAPWHLKADCQWQMRGRSVESGTIEEWWKAPDTWRRTYIVSKQTWTEWSVDRTHQFATRANSFPTYFANLRIATPLITPLFQAKNFRPEYPMQIQPLESGMHLNCLSVVNPLHYVDQIDPDFLFPKYCLDAAGVLRGLMTSNTVVGFNDPVIFDKRAVAKTVDVLVDGQKVSESKIIVLEPLASADEALLKPGPDAAPEPFTPTDSDPPPVLVHSEKPFVPANMVIAEQGGGIIRIPVVIEKDGRVRPAGFMVTQGASWPVISAAQDAAKHFRYEPYLIDGQPVEVAWGVTFTLGRNGYEPPSVGESDKPTGYDPKRDPSADLKAAEAEAQQAHKHILVVAGGDWCIWCGYLDKFFADHGDVDALLKANYVPVKVNWSAQNHNSGFFAQYAFVGEFPFFLVLDENGKLLKAQKTGELEKGQSYDPVKMAAFLNQWKPGVPPSTSVAAGSAHP